MRFTTAAFASAARKAARDPRIREVFTRAGTRLIENRDAAYAEAPGMDLARDAAREVRQKGIDDLQRWISVLEDRLTDQGAKVHHAVTARDACHIIAGILNRAGIRDVIKGKSMATEEVGLNEFLQSQGIDAVETDLGEYIVQLAGSAPSHIVGPAFHMTRADVRAIMERRLGERLSDDPEDLTRAARTVLRGKFLSAGAGITGANFIAADTGTIVLVENEGNARMTATLPRVHIVLAGIDKVIPSFSDIPTLLRVLSRSATGQGMPVYVSFVTGPGRGPLSGLPPKDLHVVLLDNGRSRILADPVFREVLLCIRCGSCLNICPVYRTIGGHAYGFAYQGPIGSVLAPLILGLESAAALPFASSLCGACREVCPVRIDLPRLLVELRSRVVEKKSKRRFDPAGAVEAGLIRAAGWLMETSSRRGRFSRLARAVSRPLVRDGRIRRLPYPLSKWTRSRDFPRPPGRTFSAWWEKRDRHA